MSEDIVTVNRHTAFVRRIDPSAARHQFRMSAVVAVSLAIATAVCGLALRPAAAHETVPVTFTVMAPSALLR